MLDFEKKAWVNGESYIGSDIHIVYHLEAQKFKFIRDMSTGRLLTEAGEIF